MNEYIRTIGTLLTNGLLQAELSVENAYNRIKNSIERLVQEYDSELSKALIVLKENDPRQILNKGFALVTEESGKPVVSSKKLSKGKKYMITMTDGSKPCRIE